MFIFDKDSRRVEIDWNKYVKNEKMKILTVAFMLLFD